MTWRCWSWSALGREAWLNTTSAGSRGLYIAMASLILGSSAAAFLVAQWQSLDEQLSAQRDLGRNVLVFSAADRSDVNFRIERRSCDALAEFPGVVAAGAVVPTGRTDIAQIGGGIATVQVSTSLVPEIRGGPGVGHSLREANPSLPTRVDAGRLGALRVTWLPKLPTGVEVNSALVLPLDPAVMYTTNCVAILEPFVDSAQARTRLSAALNTVDGAVTAVPAAQLTYDVLVEFGARPERWVALLAACVLAVGSALSRWLRASEAAAYRLSGTTRLDFIRLVVVEEAASAGVFATSALGATLAAGLILDQTRGAQSTVAWAVSAAAVQFGVASVLGAAMALRSPLALAKNR